MDELKPYTVTTENLELTDSVWDDLVSDSPKTDTVPARVVEVADERPANDRNTVYYLTDAEAELLKEDPRVQDVFNLELVKPTKFAIQEGNFNKTTGQVGSCLLYTSDAADE